MKILITGSQGQLAQEFQRSTLKDIDIFAPDEKEFDITNPDIVDKIVSRQKPDVIINCAAYNLVDNAQLDPEIAFKVNAEGVKNLALTCKKNNILIVHYGTDYIFDGTKLNFYTEEDNPNPESKYGESKLLGEKYLAQATDNYLLFRVSWVYGKGKQNFLYKLTEWAKKSDVLRVVHDQISIPTYTEDIVSITMDSINTGLRGLFHLTNSGYATRYEVAKYFFELLKLDTIILPVTSDYFSSPVKRPYFSAMSNKKISKALEITIPDWKDSLKKFVKDMRY